MFMDLISFSSSSVSTVQLHAAYLSLVPWVAKYRAQLLNSMSKLAVLSIGTFPGLLPFVTQFGFEHSLIADLQLNSLLLLFPSWNIHPLLHSHHQTRYPTIIRSGHWLALDDARPKHQTFPRALRFAFSIKYIPCNKLGNPQSHKESSGKA